MEDRKSKSVVLKPFHWLARSTVPGPNGLDDCPNQVFGASAAGTIWSCCVGQGAAWLEPCPLGRGRGFHLALHRVGEGGT